MAAHTKQKSSKKQRIAARPAAWLIVLILLVGATLAGLDLTDTTHIFHKKHAVSGPIPTIQNKNQHFSPKSSNQKATRSTASQPSSTPHTSNTPVNLKEPYGTFVSNHYPGQNGSNYEEQSECITTAAASCYIKFTQGSVVKTLPKRTTDDSGATFWLWDVKKAGLTSGEWKVEAVASMNGQTKVTRDPIALKVQ